jgi:hypothetical protein
LALPAKGERSRALLAYDFEIHETVGGVSRDDPSQLSHTRQILTVSPEDDIATTQTRRSAGIGKNFGDEHAARHAENVSEVVIANLGELRPGDWRRFRIETVEKDDSAATATKARY